MQIGQTQKFQVARLAFGLVVTLPVTGCGYHVPSMQPFHTKDADQEALRESNLVGFLKCELRAAVQEQIDNDDKAAQQTASDPRNHPSLPRMTWLKDWGAEVSMKITVDEKSAVAPGLAFNSPMANAVSVFRTGGNVVSGQSFTLGLGVSVSSEATRVETISFFYPFSDLIAEGRRPKANCGSNDDGTIDGDLKIDDFMTSKIEMARNPELLLHKEGIPDDGTVSPFDSFTYEITFIVATSGNVTPTWKLLRLSANPSGPFFNAIRTRTDDVTITMGKSVKADNVKQLSQQALAQYQANLFGQAVSAALRGQQP